MKNDKRIINIRITFVIFCGLMAGIIFSRAVILGTLKLWQAEIIAFVAVMFAIVVWVYAHITHKKNLQTKYRRKVSPILKMTAIFSLISFVVGGLITITPIARVYSYKSFDSDVFVSGTVCDYVEEDDTYKKFLLDKVSIVEGNDYYTPDCKVCIYTNKQTSVGIGDIIEFTSRLENYDSSKSSETKMLYQNIAYKSFVASNLISITNGSGNLREIIQDKTLQIMFKNLNSDNANISFAMLFGKKNNLSDEIKDMFSLSGISHILAVSGLHIGVLFGCIYFLLKKMKANKYLKIGILSAILLFYSYLCSFSPSCCRASIMCVLLAICDTFKWRYDMLSSLSIAGIIILLFSPLSLFGLSFQLSFMCIFSIIALAPSLNRVMMKMKFPKFLATSLSLSIATNIGILPLCINSFVKVGLMGVVTNIIVLPLFSVTYIFLFSIWIISLIFNFMGFLLFFPNLFMQIIKVVAKFVSALDFGLFKTFNISYWALVLIILFALVVHFLMINKTIRGSISFLLLITITYIFVATFLPTNYSGQNLIIHFKFNNNNCFFVENNITTMIGSDINNSYVLTQLRKSKISKIDNIVAYDFQLNEINNLVKICNDNNCKTLFLPRKYEYYDISSKFKNVKFFDYNIKIGSLMISAYHFNDEIIAVNLNTDKMGNVFIPKLKPNRSEAKYLHETLENNLDIDYIYLNDVDINLDLKILKPKFIISNVSRSADIYLKDIDLKVLNFG